MCKAPEQEAPHVHSNVDASKNIEANQHRNKYDGSVQMVPLGLNWTCGRGRSRHMRVLGLALYF